MHNSETDQQQSHLVEFMIAHNRTILQNPGFPKDAALKFGTELDQIEANKKAGISLNEIEGALSRISEDIEQFFSINQPRPDQDGTSKPGVVQRITRMFSGILK